MIQNAVESRGSRKQATQKEKRGCVGGWEAGMAVREVGEVVCYCDCDLCFPPSSEANVSQLVRPVTSGISDDAMHPRIEFPGSDA